MRVSTIFKALWCLPVLDVKITVSALTDKIHLHLEPILATVPLASLDCTVNKVDTMGIFVINYIREKIVFLVSVNAYISIVKIK